MSVKYHGIKGARYNDTDPTGETGTFTEIDGLVHNESQITYAEPSGDTQDPMGADYWEGRQVDALIHTNDSTSVNALEDIWADDDRVCMEVTLADDSTLRFPNVLTPITPVAIAGKLGGRVKKAVKFGKWSPTPVRPTPAP